MSENQAGEQTLHVFDPSEQACERCGVAYSAWVAREASATCTDREDVANDARGAVVTYRVCTECHLLTPVEQLQEGDVCLPCWDPERYGNPEVASVAARQETLRQLAEVTAERDALRQQLATAEACRELNQEQRDEWRERAERAMVERDALKRRVAELEKRVEDATAGPGDHV